MMAWGNTRPVSNNVVIYVQDLLEFPKTHPLSILVNESNSTTEGLWHSRDIWFISLISRLRLSRRRFIQFFELPSSRSFRSNGLKSRESFDIIFKRTNSSRIHGTAFRFAWSSIENILKDGKAIGLKYGKGRRRSREILQYAYEVKAREITKGSIHVLTLHRQRTQVIFCFRSEADEWMLKVARNKRSASTE